MSINPQHLRPFSSVGNGLEAISRNNSPSKDNATRESFWGSDGFTFGDLLDAVNPLQHIPVVSTIYRHLTGDDRSVGAKVLGGSLFGGMPGLVASFFDSVVEEGTGYGVEDHAKKILFRDSPGREEFTKNTDVLNKVKQESLEITLLENRYRSINEFYKGEDSNKLNVIT